MMNAKFFDIRCHTLGEDIRIVFPHWDPGTESMVVLSPHDDDALLGAGYMITKMVEDHVPVKIVIFCKGDTGYSSPELRGSIVKTRKAETLDAYNRLGLQSEDIIFLDMPDFSLRKRVGWDGLGTDDAIFGKMIRLLRKYHVTRLLIANGYREHSDHTAVNDIGMFDGVQAGDPILSDYGELAKLRSTHVYSSGRIFLLMTHLKTGVLSACALTWEWLSTRQLRAELLTRCSATPRRRISSAAWSGYGKKSAVIRGISNSINGWIHDPRLSYVPYVAWLNALEGY